MWSVYQKNAYLICSNIFGEVAVNRCVEVNHLSYQSYWQSSWIRTSQFNFAKLELPRMQLRTANNAKLNIQHCESKLPMMQDRTLNNTRLNSKQCNMKVQTTQDGALQVQDSSPYNVGSNFQRHKMELPMPPQDQTLTNTRLNS